MCGIFGHTFFSEDQLFRSRQSLNTLFHRGPDQWGEWHDREVYLGHRRLSILDLSDNGRQPMVSEDQDVVLVANGEVYNFQELRAELKSFYQFKSQSDSEVLLHGYRKWGIVQLLKKIQGMYAFSILDKKAGLLYIARDRVGIKPIYYFYNNKFFAFASEIKAIICFVGRQKLDADPSSLYDFLTYSYIPSPKTLYKDVCKLEPGHYVEFDLRQKALKKHCYWRLEAEVQPIAVDAAAHRLRELISEAVKAQLVSDAPVGFFLSGGMDSSTVVAEASQALPRLRTYSIGFDDRTHDETHFAALVAERFRTEHRVKVLPETYSLENFELLRAWYDEPFADCSAFSTFLVSELAKADCKVVLTGDGGDETLGGYSWYFRFLALGGPLRCFLSWSRPAISWLKNRHRWTLPGKAAYRVEPYALRDELELYARLLGGMLKADKKAYAELLQIPGDYDDYWHFRKYYRRDLPPLTRLQFVDFHTYLPDDILTKVDRASMQVSLEARVPLLDTALVEFVFSLPEDVRYWGGRLKGLMKYAYRDILPAQVLNRDKKGFSIPTRKWRGTLMPKAKSNQDLILLRQFGEFLPTA